MEDSKSLAISWVELLPYSLREGTGGKAASKRPNFVRSYTLSCHVRAKLLRLSNWEEGGGHTDTYHHSKITF